MSMVTSPTRPAWRLVLRAEFAELPRLTGWVEDFAQYAKLPSEQTFAIQLAVEEAVANIIAYSGAAENGQEIAVELGASGGEVLAVIEDRGRPFDPTTVPPRSQPASLDDAEVGKLGIHFMRNFASEMRYEGCNGCNRLTLKFSPAEAASKRPA
jgi:anti-sigma regulatory factor (Ser/Thr protein kinase)